MVTLYRDPPVCDFCSSSDIVEDYDIPDFEMPEYGWGSTGGFAACTSCSTLVKSCDKQGLEERSVSSFIAMNGLIMPESEIRRFVHCLHTEFWKRLNCA